MTEKERKLEYLYDLYHCGYMSIHPEERTPEILERMEKVKRDLDAMIKEVANGTI